ELGAEVIKIESRANIDFLRRVTVEPDAVDRSWTFNDASRGQLSVALDLRAPRGRELALRLCAAADVVIENNRGDVVRKWGLDYEDVRRLRADVVYVASQGFGRGGPPTRGTRSARPPRRRMDARAERRGGGGGAPGGGRLRHGGPERRRSPRRPTPRRARRDRDRRAPRDRPRAAQREPDPPLAHAARAAGGRPAPRRRHRGRADPRPRSLARRGGAPRRGRRAHVSATTIRDRAAIVGIGQTAFGKSLGRSEYDMALEAILAACADAGLAPRDIDGAVRYDMETTDEENLLAAL